MVYFCGLLWSIKWVKLYLVGDSALSMAKGILLSCHVSCVVNRVMFPLFHLVIMDCWSCHTRIKGRRPSPPRSKWGGRVCPSARWNGRWMLKCFLDKYPHWEAGGCITPNSSGDVPPSSPFREKGGRMHDLPRPPTWPPMSGPTGRSPLPSRQLGPKLAGKKGTCTTRCTSSKDYQGLHCVGQNRQRNWLGMWCPPWKTTWGRKGANCQEDQKSPNQQLPSHHGARTPRRRRRDTSTKRDLAEVREAH